MAKLPFQGLVLPKVIYSVDSEYNGKIEVVSLGATRTIRVDGIHQSLNWQAPNARRLVWGRAIEVLKQNEPGLKNILVLGLGGATVQHFISQDFPEAQITSVDIDPEMINVAREFFDLDQIPNHTVINTDACRLVIEPKTFDLEKHMFQAVFVDIYVGEKFPELGTSGNFLAAVKEMVVPNGLVIINRIYTKKHQDEVNNFIDFVEDFLQDVQTTVVAGYTNSDNILIYGRT